MRASCIESIGYILTSVKNKPEVCKQDALDICKNIVEVLVTGNLKDSDPQVMAISNTISQICICLKEDFKQFLPHIVPALLKDASKDLDFKVKDADEVAGDEEEEAEGTTTLNLKIKGVEGEKALSMNTNALEVKINAIQILKNLAQNLGTHMFDYVEDIAKLCIEELLLDPYTMSIRKESAKCMRYLISACKEHPEKQRALFIMTYVKLMEDLHKRYTQNAFD